MKKITKTLVTVFFAVLLFSFGTANAQTEVLFEDVPASPEKATGITDLVVNVGGTDVTFDVIFSDLVYAVEVYGDFNAPTFTFTNLTDAEAAVTAMNAAFNASPVTPIRVGEIDGFQGTPTYYIGYDTVMAGSSSNCVLTGGFYFSGPSTWGFGLELGSSFWNGDARTWAIFTEVPLGIDDEVFGASVSVYPNPADNVVHIKTTATITAINISDITGKVIQNLQFKVGASATTLDVSAFTAGVYFLKLEDDKGRVSVKKVLIQ